LNLLLLEVKADATIATITIVTTINVTDITTTITVSRVLGFGFGSSCEI